MIDLQCARLNPKEFMANIRRKDPTYDVELLMALEQRVREVRTQVEQGRAQKNERARLVAVAGGLSAEQREDERQRGEKLVKEEEELQRLEVEFRTLYLSCPNIIAPEVPDGDKAANRVTRMWGEKPLFPFEARHHVALNEQVRWFDMAVAARMSASNFVFYRGTGARLLYALALYMMRHNEAHGFSVCIPPYVVNEVALEGASQFPRFRDAVYEVGADRLFLTPTAEVNLTNIYRDHTFDLLDLPVRMTAWTSCFRREAGTYGASERGLIRIHQFEKVELYTLCAPEHAQDEHDRMIACGESILQKLGLHYRISLLAAQDCSFSSMKTYDIEVWMPGQREYKEVSSSSWCETFQARRCNIRYRSAPKEKGKFVHTLNSSSLALPRLMVAIMETYQQADGSILIPDELRKVVWSTEEAL